MSGMTFQPVAPLPGFPHLPAPVDPFQAIADCARALDRIYAVYPPREVLL